MNALSLTAWCAALFLSSTLFGHNVALRLVFLALSVLCAAVSLARHWRSLRVLPPIWPPFVLWAAWAGLSLSWSVEPARSYKEFMNEIGYVALGCWVCYIGAQAARAARIVLPIVAGATALLCAVALYTFARGVEQYADGWHGGPGSLSSTLLMLMPCALMATWYCHRVRAGAAWSIWLALIALLFLAAYTTLNRTIWFGFAVELLLLSALLVLRGHSATGPRVRTVGALLAISIIAGCAFISARVQREREATDPAAAVSQDPRMKLWPEVMKQIQQRPLTGYGFGRGLLRNSLTDEFKSPHIWHAHNLFLDTALQTGIPGLLLFLLVAASIAREGWRGFRTADSGAAACGLALLGVLSGMAVRNMTDTLLVRQNALFFWGVVGVVLAWVEETRPVTSTHP